MVDAAHDFDDLDLRSRKDSLSEAEHQIFTHPGYLAWATCRALERSLNVFRANAEELLALLDAAATDEKLAMELVQNAYEPAVRERFEILATQRLHNHVASTMSLVEHVRRLMRGRTDSVAEGFGRRKERLLQHSEIQFMQDLRNYTLHHTLPLFGHRLSMTRVNTPEQEMESEVELSVNELLAWDNWTPKSREFLRNQGETLALRPIVRRHAELVVALNTWLHNALSDANTALDDVNELVAQRNAVLAGVDIETARELTDNWTERRKRPPQRSSSSDRPAPSDTVD